MSSLAHPLCSAVGVGLGLPARYSQIEGLIAPNQAVLDVRSGHSNKQARRKDDKRRTPNTGGHKKIEKKTKAPRATINLNNERLIALCHGRQNKSCRDTEREFPNPASVSDADLPQST